MGTVPTVLLESWILISMALESHSLKTPQPDDL